MIKTLTLCLMLVLSTATIAQNSNIMSREAFLLSNPQDIALIDVRTEEEYQEGHIARAINIPHLQIMADPSVVQFNKDHPIILYCRSGNRVKKAEKALLEAGFSNITLLEGDMKGWLASGLPVVK
ncbi:rhodanese-like domain-containing protein [Paraglaciecola aestuariivivens]